MGETNNYNKEPVFYCRHCLSLKIKSVPSMTELDYCDECGTTDIGQTDIESWRTLYKNRYGIDYLDKY